MALPKIRFPGMGVREAFLWSSEAEAGQTEGRKDRPCVVVTAIRRAAQIDSMFEKLTRLDEADRRRQAIASCAAMVGATILARATTDPAFSDETLKETRAWIDEGLGRTAAIASQTA